MFAVIFDLVPRPERLEEYLRTFKAMRPQLDNIDGFIGSERYGSRTTRGRFVIVSHWESERAIANYRANQLHHATQVKARTDLLLDYRLRVGRVISQGGVIPETLPSDGADPRGYVVIAEGPVARFNSLQRSAYWYDSMYEPGKAMAWLETTETDCPAVISEARRAGAILTRVIAVSREYGMFDRTDAPQYLDPVKPPEPKK